MLGLLIPNATSGKARLSFQPIFLVIVVSLTFRRVSGQVSTCGLWALRPFGRPGSRMDPKSAGSRTISKNVQDMSIVNYNYLDFFFYLALNLE